MKIRHLLRRSTAMLLLLLVVSIPHLFAQVSGATVKGVVTNQTTGSPEQGVTVAIKSSNQTTITNEKGEFTITVPANATLIFTSIGFTRQEVKVGTQTAINVSLVAASTDKLDEVVVVGYGTQRARNITGSVVSIDPKKLEDLPVASLSEALRGQVPGVNVSGGSTRPGTLATVSIRQQFNWGKDGGGLIPLIVIDDVVQIDPSTNLPTLDQFNRLDLSEVESITVLRDASAAIYGSRASQGAIVIKTKRGKIGPPKLTYSGKFETNDAVSHGKVMSAKEYGIFNNRLQHGLGYYESGTDASRFFSAAELASMDSLNYDWLMNDWRRANTMQHTLNVSGGADRATYFAGGSYYSQGANLGQQDFSRWTFRSGTEVKLVNNVKFSAIISANNQDILNSFTKVNFQDGYAVGGEQNDYSVLLHMPKYIPWQYNINGTTQYVSPVLGPNKTGSATGNNSLSNWNYYALLNNGSQTTNNVFSYTGNFSLQYDVPFIKGLSFRGNYAKTYTSTKSEQVQMPIIFYQGTSLATTGMHLYSPSTTWKSYTNASNSRVAYDNLTGTSEQMNFFTTYDRTFGDHNVSAVFSGERSKVTSDERYQIYDNPVAGIYNGVSPTTLGTLNAQNSITRRSEGGTMSYLGRVNYSFKNRYLASFSFRSDASSKVAPSNYWGFFPGMSLGWIISDESFFRKNIRWINYLKIRGSLAKTGNDNIKAWKWLQLYSIATSTGMGFGTSGGGVYTYGLTPATAPNPDIKWDRTLQRNLGLDFAMLRNRLTVNLDEYYNSGRDLILDMSGAQNVPITVGGSFAEQNYGAVNSWGSELAITWSDKIGKDIRYSIGANFGYSNNKVLQSIVRPFNYESLVNASGTRTIGYSSYGPNWGYRTWKETSTGDGILRTDADLDAYWAYLTGLATKAGTTPYYNAGSAAISTRAGMRKGMMAYEDVAGDLNTATKTIAGQNGRINDSEDYMKLSNSSRTYGFTTNLSVSWKFVSLSAQISTNWGGINSIDRVKQGTASTNAGWSQVSYLTDMYDSTDNPNGKYPNMAFFDAAYKNSDFWTISSFRCLVRNLNIGFGLPKEWAAKAHLSSARFVLSGYNLWDLFNPYPGKYRNMYDSPNVGYPTLRTWALGVNLGF